jgi:hypothetical protein
MPDKASIRETTSLHAVLTGEVSRYSPNEALGRTKIVKTNFGGLVWEGETGAQVK